MRIGPELLHSSGGCRVRKTPRGDVGLGWRTLEFARLCRLFDLSSGLAMGPR